MPEVILPSVPAAPQSTSAGRARTLSNGQGMVETRDTTPFHVLLENAPDIIFRYEVEPPLGVTYVNSAILPTLGYTPDELYADPDLARAMLDPYDYARMKALLRTAVPPAPVTIRLRHRDGRTVWTEMRLVPLRAPDGTVIAVEGIIRDITERKLIEANLVRAEKLNSLGLMASGVAHQMNNVLATIMGHADLLMQEPLSPQARHYLEIILRAADDGAEAVRRIQGLARSEPLRRPASLDLVQIAHEAVEATAPRWRDQAECEGRSISVRVRAERPAWVSGVQSDLREVLMNLIFNAVDALPQGGWIQIEVSQHRDRVLLRVSDNGTGMSEDVIRHALDPFFTTKPFGEGMGLGLALAHRIIQQHHGSIEIRSAPGDGTTFEISLPAASPAEPDVGAPPPAALSPMRVLIVDDNPTQRQQLGKILSLDGHRVTIAESGADALARVQRDRFDVVITDLGMPDVTGWDVARETKRCQPGARVGLVTGWGSELGDPESLRALGVDFVVSKPYRIASIRNAMAQV